MESSQSSHGELKSVLKPVVVSGLVFSPGWRKLFSGEEWEKLWT